jgi:hypothetical protein
MSISVALVCISFENSHAQSSRRLCGYTSGTNYKTPDGKKETYRMAFVGEVDMNRADNLKEGDCYNLIRKAEKRMPKKIKISFPGSNKTIQLKPNWHKHRIDYGNDLTCEKLGKKYKGQGIPKDICKKMDTGPLYKLVKENAETKATITFEAWPQN